MSPYGVPVVLPRNVPVVRVRNYLLWSFCSLPTFLSMFQIVQFMLYSLEQCTFRKS